MVVPLQFRLQNLHLEQLVLRLFHRVRQGLENEVVARQVANRVEHLQHLLQLRIQFRGRWRMRATDDLGRGLATTLVHKRSLQQIMLPPPNLVGGVPLLHVFFHLHVQLGFALQFGFFGIVLDSVVADQLHQVAQNVVHLVLLSQQGQLLLHHFALGVRHQPVPVVVVENRVQQPRPVKAVVALQREQLLFRLCCVAAKENDALLELVADRAHHLEVRRRGRDVFGVVPSHKTGNRAKHFFLLTVENMQIRLLLNHLAQGLKQLVEFVYQCSLSFPQFHRCQQQLTLHVRFRALHHVLRTERRHRGQFRLHGPQRELRLLQRLLQ
mmetsp:Transcript_13811/g.34022  ORF Transcript_13811/g.34022 Transcript_13811/m.34022 type:complete len:325 (+) Transcript_13811:1000-1974(+)